MTAHQDRTNLRWWVAAPGAVSESGTWPELVARAAAGDIGPDDTVWADGDATSQLARDVPGLLPVVDLPPPAPGDLVVESTAWHMVGRGDPQILFLRPFNAEGTVRLAGGRLQFLTRRGVAKLDEPVSELHDLGLAELGAAVEVWHRDTRHRILFGGQAEVVVPPGLTGGVLGAVDLVSGVGASLRAHEGAKAVASAWFDVLAPRVGETPPGVRVRRPRQRAAYIAMGAVKFLLTLVILLALLTVVVVVAGAA